MSISNNLAESSPLKQSLAALRGGQDSFATFIDQLFVDLEALQQRVDQAEMQLELQRQQLADLRGPQSEEFQQEPNEKADSDPAMQSKVAELETERQDLEEELENIRARAVNMAQTISDQKRQMAEEHSQWVAELRQLRRILDKQAKWIAMQNENGGGPVPNGLGNSAIAGGLAAADVNSDHFANYQQGGPPRNTNGKRNHPAAARGGAESHTDPVLGSVLSQFELLQKDVARRRKQNGHDQALSAEQIPEQHNDR